MDHRVETLVMSDFPGAQLAADDDHLYWTEARVREYDDRPVFISRAAVRRRSHDTGVVETVFDFQRDDLYCTPHDPGHVAGSIGWTCCREILDSDARTDPTRYVHLRGGRLHPVPLPEGRPGQVATSGRSVLAVRERADRRTEVVRVDAVTGEREHVSVLPGGLKVERVIGVAGGALIGISWSPWALWAAPLDGGPPAELWRLPHGSIHGAAAGGDRIVVGWGAHPEHLVTVVEGGGARVVHRSRYPASALVLAGDRLYFRGEGQIRRIHLETGEVVPVVEGRPPLRDGMALGGGWLYWHQDRTLRRHPVGPPGER